MLTFLPFILLQCSNKKKHNEISEIPFNHSEKFAMEYPLVGNDNIFVYRNADEIAEILLNGRGIVFLGFNECPWCQLYAVFLHDIAKEMGIEIIYYCDIKEDRQNNSDSYQKILKIFTGRLQYDDEGRPRIYVPDVSIVSRGRIILRDYETSKDTLGFYEPNEYWNEERINALKERLRAGMNILNQLNRPCNTC